MRNIIFTPASKNSELENVIVEYGGGKWNRAIEVVNSSISIKNSIIRENKGIGLYLENSTSTIDTVQFLDHNLPENQGKAIYIEGGTAKISNSTFKRNDYGIYISKGEPILENLIFGEGDDKNTYDICLSGKCYEKYEDYKKEH